MKYSVVASKDSKIFANTLSKALSSGWKTINGFHTQVIWNPGLIRNEIYYFQPIVKDELTEREEFCLDLKQLSEEELQLVYMFVDRLKDG